MIAALLLLLAPALAVPDAPVWLNATAGVGEALLWWSASPSPDAFTIFASDDSALAVDDGDARSATFAGLTGGLNYTFTIVATDGAGDSAASAASAVVTPSAAAPAAPSALTATTDFVRVHLAWEPPSSDNGAAITQYTVTAEASGATYAVAAPSLTLYDQPLDAVAWFSVTASNAAGESAVSPVSAFVTPQRGPPTVPRNVSVARRGHGELWVNWTAPLFDNGAEVTAYHVLDADGSHLLSTPAPADAALVGRLSGLRSYAVRVRAANAQGNSSLSEAAAAVTPSYDVPAAPGALAVTPGNGSLLVTWAAARDNGAAVTKYSVSESSGAVSETTELFHLVEGLLYTDVLAFEVLAESVAGQGPAAATGSVSPLLGAPAQIDDITSFAGPLPGQITLVWTEPSGNGGTVTMYTLVSNVDGSEVVIEGSPPAVSVVISGLHGGTLYSYNGRAYNEAGGGPAQLSDFAIPPEDVPETPAGVVAVAGAGEVALNWTAPYDNGATVTAYRVNELVNDTSVSIAADDTDGYVRYTGLVAGQSYQFTITAINALGDSDATSPTDLLSPFAAPPAAPTLESAVAGDGSATLSWTAPDDNGARITEYVITNLLTSGELEVAGSPHTVTQLLGSVGYTFEVQAVNHKGRGAASAASETVTPTIGSPDQPANVAAAVGEGELTLSWTAPADNGASITLYSVYYETELGDAVTVSVTGSPAPASVLLTGLDGGREHEFEVTAFNSGGGSDPSAAVTAVPDEFDVLLTLPDGSALPSANPGVTVGEATELLVALELASDGLTVVALSRSSSNGDCQFTSAAYNMTYRDAIDVQVADGDTEADSVWLLCAEMHATGPQLTAAFASGSTLYDGVAATPNVAVGTPGAISISAEDGADLPAKLVLDEPVAVEVLVEPAALGDVSLRLEPLTASGACQLADDDEGDYGDYIDLVVADGDATATAWLRCAETDTDGVYLGAAATDSVNTYADAAMDAAEAVPVGYEGAVSIVLSNDDELPTELDGTIVVGSPLQLKVELDVPSVGVSVITVSRSDASDGCQFSTSSSGPFADTIDLSVFHSHTATYTYLRCASTDLVGPKLSTLYDTSGVNTLTDVKASVRLGVTPAELIGDLALLLARGSPAVVSDLQLSFVVINDVPAQGSLQLELPDSGWGMPAEPVVALAADDAAVLANATWDDAAAVLTVGVFGLIQGYAVVDLAVADVTTPPHQVAADVAALTTLLSAGNALDTSALVDVPAIGDGQIGGPPTWTPSVRTPGTTSRARLNMTVTGAVEAGGSMLVALPADWQFSPEVEADGQAVAARGETWVRVTVESALASGQPVTVDFANITCPPYVAAAAWGNITTFAPGGAIIDGPTPLSVARVSHPGQFLLSPTRVEVDEDAEFVTLYVQRADGREAAAGVQFETVAGSAEADADFVSVEPTRLWWDHLNNDTLAIEIDIVDDLVPELGDENFTVRLLDPVGGYLETNQTATVVIRGPSDDWSDYNASLVDLSPAPALLSAQLYDTAFEIHMAFDRPARCPSRNCTELSRCRLDRILDEETRELLGDSPTCEWWTDELLVVSYDDASLALLPGEPLFLAGDYLRSSASSIIYATGFALLEDRVNAPLFVGAEFESGSVVRAFFEGSNDQLLNGTVEPVPCERVFANEDLGSGALCAWESAAALRVLLGHAPSLRPVTDGDADDSDCRAGRSLFLLDDVVHPLVDSVEFAVGCAPVAAPPDEPQPVARVQAPAEVGPCTDVALDASASTGGSGRPLLFAWRVEPANGQARAYAVNRTWTTAGNASQLTLPAADLAPDGRYRVSLNVTNALTGAVAAAEHALLRRDSARPLPVLAVEGGTAQNVLRAEWTHLVADAQLPPSCSGEDEDDDLPTLQFHWTLGGGLLTASTRTLAIPPHTLAAGGSYAVSVTASVVGDANATAVGANATLHVRDLAPVVGLRSGFSRAWVSHHAYLDLDASYDNATGMGSYDPDDRLSGAALEYSWGCEPVTEGAECPDASTFSKMSSGPLLSIPRRRLKDGEFAISLNVTSGALTTVGAPFLIEFAETDRFPPEVVVAASSRRPHAEQRLALTGSVAAAYADETVERIEWSMPAGVLTGSLAAVALTPLDSPVLALGAGSLQSGVPYTFRLTAYQSDGAVGWREVDVTPNAPPSGGYVSAAPAAGGVGLQTEFTLRAPDWGDDDDDLPLAYSFAFQHGRRDVSSLRDDGDGADGSPGDDLRFVSAAAAASAVRTRALPPGLPPHAYELTIVARVADRLGAYAVSSRLASQELCVVAVAPAANLTAAADEALARAAAEGDAAALSRAAAAIGAALDDPCASGQVQCPLNAYCEPANGTCVCVDGGFSGAACDPPPIDGGLSAWTDWTACSVSCGGGTRSRERRCDSPEPRFGGANCSSWAALEEEEACNEDACEDPDAVVHGRYGAWGDWGECSTSCPGVVGGLFPGAEMRERACDSPAPSPLGLNCSERYGAARQYRPCNTAYCPGPPKECPGACSGHGVCLRAPWDCAVEDRRCDELACSCDAGWAGPACAATDAEWAARRALRLRAAVALVDSGQRLPNTTDALELRAASAAAVVAVPEEVPAAARALVASDLALLASAASAASSSSVGDQMLRRALAAAAGVVRAEEADFYDGAALPTVRDAVAALVALATADAASGEAPLALFGGSDAAMAGVGRAREHYDNASTVALATDAGMAVGWEVELPEWVESSNATRRLLSQSLSATDPDANLTLTYWSADPLGGAQDAHPVHEAVRVESSAGLEGRAVVSLPSPGYAGAARAWCAHWNESEGAWSATRLVVVAASADAVQCEAPFEGYFGLQTTRADTASDRDHALDVGDAALWIDTTVTVAMPAWTLLGISCAFVLALEALRRVDVAERAERAELIEEEYLAYGHFGASGAYRYAEDGPEMLRRLFRCFHLWLSLLKAHALDRAQLQRSQRCALLWTALLWMTMLISLFYRQVRQRAQNFCGAILFAIAAQLLVTLLAFAFRWLNLPPDSGTLEWRDALKLMTREEVRRRKRRKRLHLQRLQAKRDAKNVPFLMFEDTTQEKKEGDPRVSGPQLDLVDRELQKARREFLPGMVEDGMKRAQAERKPRKKAPVAAETLGPALMQLAGKDVLPRTAGPSLQLIDKKEEERKVVVHELRRGTVVGAPYVRRRQADMFESNMPKRPVALRLVRTNLFLLLLGGVMCLSGLGVAADANFGLFFGGIGAVLGFVLCVLSVMGVFAAEFENPVTLRAFLVFTALLFMMQLSYASIVMSLSEGDNEDMMELLREVWKGFHSQIEATTDNSYQVLTQIQSDGGCCGFHGPDDYPVDCFQPTNVTIGCAHVLMDKLEGNLLPVSVVAVLAAAAQLASFAMAFWMKLKPTPIIRLGHKAKRFLTTALPEAASSYEYLTTVLRTQALFRGYQGRQRVHRLRELRAWQARARERRRMLALLWVAVVLINVLAAYTSILYASKFDAWRQREWWEMMLITFATHALFADPAAVLLILFFTGVRQFLKPKQADGEDLADAPVAQKPHLFVRAAAGAAAKVTTKVIPLK